MTLRVIFSNKIAVVSQQQTLPLFSANSTRLFVSETDDERGVAHTTSMGVQVPFPFFFDSTLDLAVCENQDVVALARLNYISRDNKINYNS